MDKIQNNAMLIAATIKKFSNSRKDTSISAEVAATKNANPKVITVTKKLLDAPAIKALNRIAGQLRNSVLNPVTMPWEDGVRLITVDQIETFEAEWDKKVDRAEELKREVITEWPNILKRAKKDLGDSFDISELPSAEFVAGSYQFSYILRAMPDSGDIRVNLPADKIAKIKAQAESDINKRVESAAESVHERVIDTLQSLVDGLERHGSKPAGAKRASKFADTTVENIEKLAQVLPSLNITGDPKLAQASNAILSQLNGLDPQRLRDSSSERQVVANKAKSIVDNLTGLWD